MKKYILIGLILTLSACVHSSDESVIASYKDNAQVINSSLNYEESYRIISKKYKICNRAEVGIGEDQVESHIDNQKQIGRITQSIKSPFFTNYIVVIDIKPSNNGSIISVYSRNGALDPDVARWINAWLSGDDRCKI